MIYVQKFSIGQEVVRAFQEGVLAYQGAVLSFLVVLPSYHPSYQVVGLSYLLVVQASLVWEQQLPLLHPAGDKKIDSL